MDRPQGFPQVRQVVLDATNARQLAEFYRQLLGYAYRAGDEPPPADQPDPKGEDWLVIRDAQSGARIAFQRVDSLPSSTWPNAAVPQQLHLDLTVGSTEALEVQLQRALALGARVLQDRSDDPLEPLYVFADPAGHPFCIFVAPD
ncbi:MAG TPA: VOC family protein [Chloroflexota bacterium]